MAYNGTSPWTAQRDDQLRALWASGLPTKAIGAAMGISKNSVIGRAHRLGLPPRESPLPPGARNRVIEAAQQAAAMARELPAPRDALEEAYAAIRRGVPYKEAAKIAGIHHATLYDKAKRAGVSPPRAERIIAPVEALEAVRRGVTYERAAAEAGMATTTLRRVALREGAAPSHDVRLIAPREAAELSSNTLKFARPAACQAQRRGYWWQMWGDKEAPTHRYCDKPRTVKGGKVKPYCAEHHALAWLRLGSAA